MTPWHPAREPCGAAAPSSLFYDTLIALEENPVPTEQLLPSMNANFNY